MAKSTILKELANDEISIDKALKRLMLLANDLGDDELYAWSDKELTGYDSNDELPEYRKLFSDSFVCSGIKGNSFNHFKLTNAPLSVMSFAKSVEDAQELCSVSIREPIGNIVENANMEAEAHLSLNHIHLQRQVYETTQIQCVTLEQRLSPAHMRAIVAKITQKLLKIFMKLDKEYGNLDELDIDTAGIPKAQIDKTAAEIKQIIYADSVTINNTNLESANIVNSNIQQGTTGSAQANESVYNDVESIVATIRKDIDTYGLDKEKKAELLKLADEAEKAEKQKKPSKLKKVLLSIGGALKDVAVGTAASLLAKTIGGQ